MKEKSLSLLEKVKNIKRSQLLLAALFGILLLVIALPTGSTEEEPKREPVKEQEETAGYEEDAALPGGTMTAEEYRKSLERQLQEVLQTVDGVGRTEVMITLKSAGKVVVEKDVTRTGEMVKEEDAQGTKRDSQVNNFQEETQYVQEEGFSTPFITEENMPEIEGVLVVAEGGGNAVTVKNISDAVLALFDVEAHKIMVVKMN